MQRKNRMKWLKTLGGILSLFLLFSCAKNLEDSNLQAGGINNADSSPQFNLDKDYNYFFKVIIPQEKNLTRSQEDAIAKNIQVMGKIFESKVKVTRAYKSDNTDQIETPAYTMAVLISSNQVKKIAGDIYQQGGKVLFSYEQLLIDRSSQSELLSGETKKNIPVKVFTYKAGTQDVNNWQTGNFPVSLKKGSEEEFGEILNLEIKDTAIVQNLMDTTVDHLTSMDGSSVQVNELSNTAVIKAGDADLQIEFDPTDTATKSGAKTKWFGSKLWNKAKKIINNAWNDWKALPWYGKIGFGVLFIGGGACFLSGVCSASVSGGLLTFSIIF